MGKGGEGAGINAKRLVPNGLGKRARPRPMLGVVVVVLAPGVMEDGEQQHRVRVGPLATGHEQPVLSHAPPMGITVDAVAMPSGLERGGDGIGELR